MENQNTNEINNGRNYLHQIKKEIKDRMTPYYLPSFLANNSIGAVVGFSVYNLKDQILPVAANICSGIYSLAIPSSAMKTAIENMDNLQYAAVCAMTGLIYNDLINISPEIKALRKKAKSYWKKNLETKINGEN